MRTVHFAGRPAAVVSATLELFHLYSRRPGWVLDATLDGPIGRLWIAGTADADTAPRRLDVEYVDAPAIVTLDDRTGTLAPADGAHLLVRELGAGLARIEGTLALRWTSGDTERPYEIAVDLVAALVT
ncbi:MAG: hypothetical protein KF773_16295 [Deltaproteobacteria bacterium]|nr:hypothetical protein [Deltaproteobacteria bacterium]MCW5803734.1 hypothetical protein [Deltaproteobacteria bacterium]